MLYCCDKLLAPSLRRVMTLNICRESYWSAETVSTTRAFPILLAPNEQDDRF